jgi:ABC-type polysaccharide/polyol phosphate transport system ATPase subunit
MAQYIYTMNRVSKVVPPKRTILRDISLSFFPGAKIGVLGLNGSGKSTLLRIMAGVDTNIDGEASRASIQPRMYAAMSWKAWARPSAWCSASTRSATSSRSPWTKRR